MNAEAITDLGLVYVSDTEPGIRRRRKGKGFSYVMPDGTTLADELQRARIGALGLPQPMRMSGSASTTTAICRRQASMRAGASNTATIRNGNPSEVRENSIN